MIESMLEAWDGENVIIRYDRATGAWIIIAVHSTQLGPATGGTRMRHYASFDEALGDALRLAGSMTYKLAMTGLLQGGGKAVLSIPQDLTQQSRSDLLRRYGKLVHQLGGLFYTGPDVGTGPEDMDVIAETGAPYVSCLTPQAGGTGSSGPATALGVFTGIQVACEFVFGRESLEGRSVLVQGVGSVGRTLIRYLRDAGAEVIFSEVDEGIVQHYRGNLGLQSIAPEEVPKTACDVYAPCALGGVLNDRTIPQLKCRIVVGGANNQLAHPEDAVKLKDRDILYAPDFVVNMGGVMSGIGIEHLGWSREKAEKRVVERVREVLQRVFELAESEGITTEAAALRIADQRLAG